MSIVIKHRKRWKCSDAEKSLVYSPWKMNSTKVPTKQVRQVPRKTVKKRNVQKSRSRGTSMRINQTIMTMIQPKNKVKEPKPINSNPDLTAKPPLLLV